MINENDYSTDLPLSNLWPVKDLGSVIDLIWAGIVFHRWVAFIENADCPNSNRDMAFYSSLSHTC